MMHRHADRAGPPTPDALRSGQDLIVRRGGCNPARRQNSDMRTGPLPSNPDRRPARGITALDKLARPAARHARLRVPNPAPPTQSP
jgi:hypothetical protein